MWKAFLTGSRAYGSPRPDSDLDIVLRLPQEALDVLIAATDDRKVRRHPENNSVSLWFDNLNLICITSDKFFQAWEEGTATLVAKAPVTRETAIEEMNSRGVTKSLASQDPVLPLSVEEVPF